MSEQTESQGVDYFTAPMQDGDIEVLARLLVRYHNTMTPEKASFYGHRMDKALARDTFSTLFVIGRYMNLCEIRDHFLE